MALLTAGEVTEFTAVDRFAQTRRGAVMATEGHGTIPDRMRMLLLLVNGRRTVADFRDLLPRYRNLDEAFDMLVKMGLIEIVRRPGA
ncbi:MAG: hypothetical protein AB7P21_20185 [Lautropia sp.]